MENKIIFNLTAEEQQIINTAIESIKTVLMPKLVTLTVEERKEMPHLGNKSMAFTVKALEYAEKTPHLVPSYITLEDFKYDLDGHELLREIIQSLVPVTEALDDTRAATGSEAYQAALIFYAAVKMAAKNNVPGAKAIYDDLRYLFPRRGKVSVKPGNEENTSKAE